MARLLLILLLFSVPFTNIYAQDLDFKTPYYYLLTTTLSPTVSTILIQESTENANWGKHSKKVTLKYFISKNVDYIAIDISKGQGEYLDSISEIAGLDKNIRPCFYEKLKNNFDQIFPDLNTDVNHVYMMIKGLIQGAKKHCPKG